MTTETDKLVEMAQLFHDTYEALAPAFGYETRPDTKAFDPESPNGKLMCATVAKVRTAIIASLCGDVEQDGFRLVSVNAGFTELLEALDRADRKGYMPDAIYSAYEGFECRDPASTVAALKAENEALRARVAELEEAALQFISDFGQAQEQAEKAAALTKGQP